MYFMYDKLPVHTKDDNYKIMIKNAFKNHRNNRLKHKYNDYCEN